MPAALIWYERRCRLVPTTHSLMQRPSDRHRVSQRVHAVVLVTPYPCHCRAQAEMVSVLEGHTGGVRTMSVSPDGSTLYSSGEDKSIRCGPHSSACAVRTGEGIPWLFTPWHHCVRIPLIARRHVDLPPPIACPLCPHPLTSHHALPAPPGCGPSGRLAAPCSTPCGMLTPAAPCPPPPGCGPSGQLAAPCSTPCGTPTLAGSGRCWSGQQAVCCTQDQVGGHIHLAHRAGIASLEGGGWTESLPRLAQTRWGEARCIQSEAKAPFLPPSLQTLQHLRPCLPPSLQATTPFGYGPCPRRRHCRFCAMWFRGTRTRCAPWSPAATGPSSTQAATTGKGERGQ